MSVIALTEVFRDTDQDVMFQPSSRNTIKLDIEDEPEKLTRARVRPVTSWRDFKRCEN